MSYDPLAWHDFFVMLGGAAAALTGLIFVALSLHLDRIMATPYYRVRAGVSVAGLTSEVVLCGAVLVPTQGHIALGIEILLNSAFFIWLLRRAARHPVPADVQHPHPLTQVVFGFLLNAVFIAAGIAILLDSGWGFLLLSVALGGSLVSIIDSAWELMTELRVPQTPVT
jgi:modulator of FtsH protease